MKGGLSSLEIVQESQVYLDGCRIFDISRDHGKIKLAFKTRTGIRELELVELEKMLEAVVKNQTGNLFGGIPEH